MCWATSKLPKKCIAKKDIHVYKIIQEHDHEICFSLIKNYPYYYDKLYTLEKEIRIYEDNIIKEGYHSYASFSKVIKEHKRWYMLTMSNIKIVQCIIPKGSTFYKNEDKEIVSDAIIIKNPYKIAIEDKKIILKIIYFWLLMISLILMGLFYIKAIY